MNSPLLNLFKYYVIRKYSTLIKQSSFCPFLKNCNTVTPSPHLKFVINCNTLAWPPPIISDYVIQHSPNLVFAWIQSFIPNIIQTLQIEWWSIFHAGNGATQMEAEWGQVYWIICHIPPEGSGKQNILKFGQPNPQNPSPWALFN